MPYDGPAHQNMISREEPATVLERHVANLRHYDATDADCRILDMRPATGLDARQGYRSVYRVYWTTYKGWKAYMLGTGCYAMDMKHEPATVPQGWDSIEG